MSETLEPVPDSEPYWTPVGPGRMATATKIGRWINSKTVPVPNHIRYILAGCRSTLLNNMDLSPSQQKVMEDWGQFRTIEVAKRRKPSTAEQIRAYLDSGPAISKKAVGILEDAIENLLWQGKMTPQQSGTWGRLKGQGQTPR